MNTLARASRWTLPLVFLVVVGTAPMATASTLTLNQAGGTLGFNSNPAFLTSGAWVDGVTPQTAGFTAHNHFDKNDDGWGGGDQQQWAQGTYDNGLFGLYARTANWGGLDGSHRNAAAHGELYLDDLMISTSDPSPAVTVLTSLNFHVSGAISTFNFYKNDILTSEFDMTIDLAGNVFTGQYDLLQSGDDVTTTDSHTVLGLATQIAGGGFSNAFSATITTGTVAVPVNTPFAIRMSFVTKAGGGGGGSPAHFSDITFEAMNTAGFLLGASILNLPAGYTLNGGNGLIVNNAAVPEPGSFALFGSLLGMGLIGPWWRRR